MMTERRYFKLSDQPTTEKKKTGKRIKIVRFLRIVALFLAVIVVLSIILSLLFPSVRLWFKKVFAWLRRVLNLDNVVRFFRYMGLRNKTGYGSVTFDAGSSNGYAAFGGGLLVSNEGGMVLYDLEGEQKAVIQASLPTPILLSGSEISLCYSPGSSCMIAMDDDGKPVLDQAQTGEILDADVTDDGCIAYLMTQTGYKSVATVLNQNQEAMFRFSSRTRYLNACSISEGGEKLAVATLGEENSLFCSGVAIFRTDRAVSDLNDPDSSVVQVNLGNQIIYDLEFLDSTHLCAIGQNELMFLDTDGTLLERVSLSEKTIVDYAFSSDGYCAFVFENQISGMNQSLVTFDEEGQILGELRPAETILDISANEKYVTMLTGRELQIYNQNLNLYYQTSDVNEAISVCARDDGTALLISYSSAKLFIP